MHKFYDRSLVHRSEGCEKNKKSKSVNEITQLLSSETHKLTIIYGLTTLNSIIENFSLVWNNISLSPLVYQPHFRGKLRLIFHANIYFRLFFCFSQLKEWETRSSEMRWNEIFRLMSITEQPLCDWLFVHR